jgi:hypothetical protein
MTVFIYALWESGEPNPRYVGQTVDLHKRFQSHRSDTTNSDKYAWLNSGVIINIITLAKLTDFTKPQIKIKEQYFVETLKPRYNLIYSTTRHFRMQAGRMQSFKSKTLADLTKPFEVKQPQHNRKRVDWPDSYP